ncbi:uncharacterized protein HMPREF1541_03276 [Cyphellophora europaea CBS 101466]|uniref:Class II aldolase/adducin N-terminal domain-containing protein n=1 Tax=Cyphellophora europaea (strain CBS 101466) TaxID=1220924 RepID=W2RXV4_CYPE1|nr:uncharacterized protein HMPREF1541_03276 [Cyphellophora europaea CBS 101466]ETN41341.1 hypothetical protein HMPREF1541_03276 [Cyphellophora europaea CBS 101466]
MSTTATTTTTTAEAQTRLSTADQDTPAAGQRAHKRLHYIPRPADKHEERKWQLEHMAGAFRVFAKLGYCDGASGHISLRDPVDTNTFWINPYGIHFGLLKASDMVRVDEEGNRVGGADLPVPTAGFLIHSQIHQARPDINAACHLHSPYGRAWSTFGKPIEMLNQDSCMFYNDLSVYAGFGGVVFAKDEGIRIAKEMGPTNKNIILQNHGILTAGGTVDEAAAFFIALERACHCQMVVENAALANPSLKKTYVGHEEAEYTKKGTGSPEVMFMQFKNEYDMIVKESGGDFLL